MKPIQGNTEGFRPAQTIELLNLFPTTMLRGQFDLPHELIAEDCRRLVAKVNKRWPSDYNRNYTTYFDKDVRDETHELPWFSDFTDIAKDTYIEFIRNMYHMNVKDLTRHDIHFYAWISVYNEPHHHPLHNHEQCHVSGTYYVQSNIESQPIKFQNPNILANGVLQTIGDMIPISENELWYGTEGVVDEVHFRNQSGDFLMWPSYLMHEVPRLDYNDDKHDNYERIAISFNFKHNTPIDSNLTGTQLRYRDVIRDE